MRVPACPAGVSSTARSARGTGTGHARNGGADPLGGGGEEMTADSKEM